MILDGLAVFGRTLEEWRTDDRPHRRGGRQAGLAYIADMAGHAPPPPLSEVVDDEPLPARVYRGQWIVDCTCNGAAYVWLDVPLTWCACCGNRYCGGRWRRVALPPERAAIERMLLLRPDAANRNWQPGETVADLVAENAAHGVAS
jgi:hypothetical protein